VIDERIGLGGRKGWGCVVFKEKRFGRMVECLSAYGFYVHQIKISESKIWHNKSIFLPIKFI
jgi:hypothetical protein